MRFLFCELNHSRCQSAFILASFGETMHWIVRVTLSDNDVVDVCGNESHDDVLRISAPTLQSPELLEQAKRLSQLVTTLKFTIFSISFPSFAKSIQPLPMLPHNSNHDVRFIFS